MRVVLLAADDFVAPVLGDDDEVLQRLGLRKPYLLAVGAADPRKNLALLERAMPQVVAAHPGVTLALAGPRDDHSAAEAPWQRTLGFVDENDLAALYRSAEALVVPSTYEGFGLPPLEAMQLGTPVVCARASSLPEVGGEAAAWVDPHDDGQLAAILTRLLGDPSLRASMRRAGLAQAARFSWDETARRTLSAFDEAVQRVGSRR
jgi:alpha-1,3-rhamnosyl/mannosyltransferase